jgi:hypothetical protein
MKPSFERCTKCILSASFPRIEFDENGVCNFCRNTFLFTAEDDVIEKAAKDIESLINEYRGKHEYDAVMCYSGGKDSTYTLMLAVQKYRLKVLSFTLDNGFMSQTAFDNISNVVDELGVDQITFRPSKKHMQAIIKASAFHPIYNAKSLTRISSVCNSCISIVNMMSLKIALEKNIPFILAGFTLGQIPVNSIIYKNNYQFLKESREAPLARLRDKAGKFIDDYFSIVDSLINEHTKYPSTLNLLCVEKLSEKQILEAVNSIGWVEPADVDGCSSNCRLNSFSNMVHEKTFGYNPYELELSRLIRKGLMTREEALEKIKDQPVEQQRAAMNELGIKEIDLDKLSQIYKK